MRDEHVDCDGERGNIVLSHIAVAREHRLKVALCPGETQEDAHQHLRDEKGAKANVSAFLAEEFPEFVAELEAEHGGLLQGCKVTRLQG